MSILAQVGAAGFVGVAGILLLFGLWEEGYGVRLRRDRAQRRNTDLE